MTLFPSLGSPLVVGGVTIANRVLLAPMSGVTDEPLRLRALRHGAGLVVSEMVASGELVKDRGQSALRIRRPDVPVHMVQLAGREASAMAEAARIAEGEGADIIDINMGCPAKKVTGGYCGSALMRVPEQALSLIEAVISAVRVPVTVKMRLGWDNTCLNAPELAYRAQEAGVAMVTIHGRTREQFYKGSADWSAVRLVREAIRVPLVVNGDIKSADDARQALALSGADAVMVGRAHYGAPWAAGTIARAFGSSPAQPAPQSDSEVCAYVSAHYEDMLALYGREQGLRHSRKHLGWYLDRFAPDADADLRRTIMTSFEPATVMAALPLAFQSTPARQAA